MKTYISIGFSLLFILSIIGCNDEAPTPEEQEDLAKETLFELMNTYYLWEDEIPNGIDPDDYADVHELLDAMRYQPRDASLSYVEDLQEFRDRINSGSTGNVGFGVNLVAEYDETNPNLLETIYIRESFSNARDAGINRGDQLIGINQQLIKGLTTDQFNNLLAEVSEAGNAVFNLTTVDGIDQDIQVSTGEINIEAITLDRIIESNGKKVGYLALRSFLREGLANDVRAIFQSFASQNIDEIVLDFRYNGGGYVSVAQLMAEMIVPAEFYGKEFITFQHNDIISAEFDSTLILTAPNSSRNYPELNLPRVFILTTGRTASASELVAVGLAPYIDVYLVGAQTFGKPVGSYTIEDEETNYMYSLISFQNVQNELNIDYFDGLPVDFEAADGYQYPWGDPRDPMLGAALNFIDNGSFGVAARKVSVIPSINFDEISSKEEAAYGAVVPLKK
ncbi:S41 family peptidase [Algivirga pacifica]|uniref:S41 family peptidase n=1 Tax=Algivirga pacifica TaxID=1162670 RepID=A0ABP9DAV5_9BACT